MLVVVSDLHLTDETTADNVHADAFSEVLLPEILSRAETKEPREIKILLLGDIFDPVRTDFWLRVRSGERPWNGELSGDTAMNISPAVEKHYQRALERIFRTAGSKALFTMLNQIKPGVKTLLKRDIPTVLVYVPGNHDRVLNNFSSLRTAIEQQLDRVDGVEFLNVLYAPEYGVLARHGHEWDPNCHGYEFYRDVLKEDPAMGRFDTECYRVQTIGEAITAELMSGIVHRVAEELGPTDPEFTRKMKDLNNIRPMTDVFMWLEWFVRNQLDSARKIDAKKQAVLMRALRESLKATLETELAATWDDIINEIWLFRGDITDRLEQLVAYIKGKSFDDLKRSAELWKVFDGVFGSAKDDYVEGARKEWDNGLAKEIQYVVYGHTHEARHDLFSGRPDGTVNMYINTGTYLPLIQRAGNGFASAFQMTKTFFYRGDEDVDGKHGNKPSMELWNGIKRKEYKYAYRRSGRRSSKRR